MTPEELDEARAKEAVRRFGEPGDKYELANERELAAIAARLAREGWTPPEPEPVNPDIWAFMEWWGSEEGDGDPKRAYLAGARMAREQERERAKVLEDRISDLVERVTDDGKQDSVTGVNASEMISARAALAEYRGEA